MEELSKIAAIAGQGGLFKVVTPLKNGVVMESLDDKKTKQVAGPSSKVSILSEISVYTTSADGAVLLADIFLDWFAKFGATLPVNSKSDGADLRKTLLSVLPDADMDRVYSSDIKKMVTWYQILATQLPELFSVKSAESAPAEEVIVSEEKPKKAAKKKNSDAIA